MIFIVLIYFMHKFSNKLYVGAEYFYFHIVTVGNDAKISNKSSQQTMLLITYK